jgi:hypothetical protein
LNGGSNYTGISSAQAPVAGGITNFGDISLSLPLMLVSSAGNNQILEYNNITTSAVLGRLCRPPVAV